MKIINNPTANIQSPLAAEDLVASGAAISGRHVQSDKPRISVVIPLYNKREEIAATLESVLVQSVQPLEIIVVDDGSTDGSADLVAQRFGHRVVLIEQANGGVSAARNTGIEAAKGDYIALLDADDFWAAHYLEEITALIKSYPQAGTLATSYQYCEGDQSYVNPKIRFDKKVFKADLLDCYFSVAAKGDLPFNASSVVMKKSLLESLRGFPINEPMGEDQDVWSRAALRAPVAYSPKVLSFYNRAATGRACEATPPQTECPFSRRLYTYALNANISDELRQSVIRYTATHLLDLAGRNITAGDLQAARDLLKDKRCGLLKLKHKRMQARLVLASCKPAFLKIAPATSAA